MAVMTPGAVAAVVAKAGHAVDLMRSIETEDAIGGRNRVWNTITEDIACWVQPASGSTMEWWAERGITITHRIYFATEPGAQIGDRFLFGTRHMVLEGAQDVAETSELWYGDCRETKAVV